MRKIAVLLLICSAVAAAAQITGGIPPTLYTMTNTIGAYPTTVYGAFSGTDAGKCLVPLNNSLPNGTYSVSTIPCTGMSGSPPTATGTCPVQTQVGGNIGGSFVMNGACIAGTVILTFAFTANNGWFCDAHDQTTPTDAIRIISSTATTATLSGTTAASDAITFLCSPY